MSSASKTTVTMPPWLRSKIKNLAIRAYTSGAPHAMAIHEGRRPGARGPGSEMLKAWCRQKLGNEKLAFVVARAIHKKGFNPAHHGGEKAAKFFEKPFHANARRWIKGFADMVVKDQLSIKEAAGRTAMEWENAAIDVLDKYWSWSGGGHLKASIKHEIEGG